MSHVGVTSTSMLICPQNSMRATVELHENSLDGLPPVKARVTLGKEDLSVKVNELSVPAIDPSG